MTATESAPPADDHPHRALLRRLLIGGFGVSMAAVALLVALLAWYAPQLPSLAPVTNYRPHQPLQVFTADGVEIAQFGSERRLFVPIDKIPLQLQQAVLAVEDARFYEHPGIDLQGLARALAVQLGGGLRQGASTITQQVARTFFLSQRFSLGRKVKEALLALEIERRLDKPQILELYMNQIYLGQHSYGFAAAAQTYFGKSLDQLSLAEVAMLAGLPQNPHFANPVTNLERATQRQRVVLARMVATGAITPAQQAAARAQTLVLRSPGQDVLHAEHVAEMARRLVVERFGADAYSRGLRVVTSLRAADQQAAWAAVRRGVLAYDAGRPWRGAEGNETLPDDDGPELETAAALALKDYRDDEMLRLAIVLHAGPDEVLAQLAGGERVMLNGEALRVARAGLAAQAPDALALRRGAVLRLVQGPGGAWAVAQWPELQAALVSLDAASGRVRALVGGFDFARQPLNHVTQAHRQPGSSFKPFLYSAALEHGVMPATLVNDAPFTAPDGWQPHNSDGRFDGPITLRQALARSRNLASVRVLQQVGLADARAWAERFGFAPAALPANLALALGDGSTTPMQLAQAYAVLANGGWPVSPVVIERITDARGATLFEAPAAPAAGERRRAVPARNVFLVDSMLNDVTRIGTAVQARVRLGRSDLYGKTGTTNGAVDVWFAGFQAGAGDGPVAVVWLGDDDAQSLGSSASGGALALPVWIDYMAQALRGVPLAPPLLPPEGVVRRDDDWVYSEWADGGMVEGIGLADPAASAGNAAPVGPVAAVATPATASAPRPGL